jgi:hypothetical protein
MERALTTTPGVHWAMGKSREATLALIAQHDVALGWRSPELDDSLELSTKLLEYGAIGTPAVINRTQMHEELLGADYPLFASSRDELERVIIEARDASVRTLAAQRLSGLVERYRFSAVAQRLAPYIDRAVPPRDLRRSRPLRVLVACHDFKFFTRIQDHLAAMRGIELRVDAWSAIDKHDEKLSEELLAWADVVICEWCTNNAIWYSQRKRPGQKLIVRLHRFELYGQYVKKLAFDAVDKMVFVGDFYRDEAIARMKWARDRLTVMLAVQPRDDRHRAHAQAPRSRDHRAREAARGRRPLPAVRQEQAGVGVPVDLVGGRRGGALPRGVRADPREPAPTRRGPLRRVRR